MRQCCKACHTHPCPFERKTELGGHTVRQWDKLTIKEKCNILWPQKPMGQFEMAEKPKRQCHIVPPAPPPPDDSEYKPHMVFVWIVRAFCFWLLVGAVAWALAGCAGQGSVVVGPPVVENVNQIVNASMAYKPDGEDVWRTDCPAQGDCEDYALCKARQLLAKGYSPNSLALWVVDSSAGPHAVLVVDNQYTLDNQFGFVWQWPTQGHMYYGCRLDGMMLVPQQDGGVQVVKNTSEKCAIASKLGGV